MTATKKLSETGYKPRWKLTVEKSGDWKAESQFGSVESAVVVDDNGKPVFDRPLYREAPNVNCIVVWGWDENDEARFAVIRQPRPHADDPENPGNNHPPVVFGQIPMGFLKKITGESIENGAVREVGEETGVSVILNIERPKYPWHNPNPTFVASWSDLVFLEVDLKKINELKSTRNEPIYSAEFITLSELMKRTANGKDEEGTVYRMCTANSIWWIFFCSHPELLFQKNNDEQDWI